MKLFSSLRRAGCIRLVLFVLPVLLTGGEGVAAPPGGPLAFRGFSGGMALHTGWVGGGNVRLTTPAGRPLPVQRVRGVPFGIGGSIRFHFGEHLRVGTEGYGTYLDYGGTGSRFGIGWGGLLVDWQWHAGRFHPFAGVTVGGGVVRNTTFTHPAGNADGPYPPDGESRLAGECRASAARLSAGAEALCGLHLLPLRRVTLQGDIDRLPVEYRYDCY